MTEEEINAMLVGVDVDGDGEVDYQEFILMMSDKWDNQDQTIKQKSELTE